METLNITSSTKIYVHITAGLATGGIELLHQLVCFLRDNGKDAYCVLLGDKPHIIRPEYTKYNVVAIEESNIIDSPNNIEVYPESRGKELIENTRSTQKLFWWLSVDNYYALKTINLSLWDLYRWDKKEFWYFFKHYVKMFLKGKNEYKKKFSIRDFTKKKVLFAYQCEYIRQHLLNRGVKKMVPLMDYINTDYICDICVNNRKDVVLYNPVKGLEFTQKLIAASSDIEWIALKGLTRKQLIEIMQTSKVYVDFGNHPGKDRLPRECAMNGCCVITGKRGAAAYNEDVMIPKEYKFDQDRIPVNIIVDKIRQTLLSYSEKVNDFAEYRKKIMGEKIEFEEQIKNIFSI